MFHLTTHRIVAALAVTALLVPALAMTNPGSSYSLFSLPSDLIQNIVGRIQYLKTLAHISLINQAGHDVAEPMLKAHRIFHSLTEVSEIPELIKDLADGILNGDPLLKQFAQRITPEDAVRLCHRLTDSCKDCQAIDYNHNLINVRRSGEPVLTADQVSNSFKLLVTVVNPNIFTDMYSIFLSPTGFLTGFHHLNLPDPRNEIPERILAAVSMALQNPPQTITNNQNAAIVSDIRNRYPAPFNQVFPLNFNVSFRVALNTSVINELHNVSVIRALLRNGIRFQGDDFFTSPVPAQSIPSILPLLSIPYPSRTLQAMSQDLVNASPEQILALLKVKEFQDMILTSPDVFVGFLHNAVGQGNRAMVEAVLKDPFIVKLAVAASNIPSKPTLWRCSLALSRGDISAMLLSVPGFDLYEDTETNIPFRPDDEINNDDGIYPWLDDPTNNVDPVIVCKRTKLDLLFSSSTFPNVLDQVLATPEFKTLILSNPGAFHDFLRDQPTNDPDRIVKFLSDKCPFIHEIMLQCPCDAQCTSHHGCSKIRTLIQSSKFI